MRIVFCVMRMRIREQDPLKQGLKPSPARQKENLDRYSRARSIKTRIETRESWVHRRHNIIREQDPLKQGLKRSPLRRGVRP